MKKTLIAATFVASVYATTTNVSFQSQTQTATNPENEYGERITYESVIVDTTDFSVDKFWNKFRDATAAQNKTFSMDLQTSVLFKLTTQSTFTCEKAGLDAEGCSGQKPLFINKSVLSNTDLQVDADGNALPLGEYRIPFDKAANYTPTRNDAFYALDVYRDDVYYTDQGLAEDDPDPKNFFGRLLAFFKDYFSKETTVYTNGNDNPLLRQRYIANLTYGIQQSYKIPKNSAIDASLNAADASGAVSLLDYDSQAITEVNGCNGLILNYNPNSLPCKTIRFFGFSNFMPFIGDSQNDIVNIDTTSVLEDTETVLLTLASNLNNLKGSDSYVEQMRSRIDAVDDTTEQSIVKELFKPMINMMSGMYRFFFGSRSNVKTQKVYIDFDFDIPLPIQMNVVENGVVTSFANFDLKGIESVYGTEVQECRLYQSASGPMGAMFDMLFGVDKYTVRPNEPLHNDLREIYLGRTRKVLGDDPSINEHNLLNTRREEIQICAPFVGCYGTGEYKVYAQLTTDDWLDWCSRNKENGGKDGIFGRFIGAIIDLFTQPNTYEAQLDDLLNDEHYYVKDYKEQVHKGLILHLLQKDITAIEVGDVGTTTKIEIEAISKNATDKNAHPHGGGGSAMPSGTRN